MIDATFSFACGIPFIEFAVLGCLLSVEQRNLVGQFPKRSSAISLPVAMSLLNKTPASE